MQTLIPTPKVATGGITGIVTAFILYELSNRFQIVLAPEESSLITTLVSFAASYLAPHSKPTPEQIAEIKQNCEPDYDPNLGYRPTTPL